MVKKCSDFVQHRRQLCEYKLTRFSWTVAEFPRQARGKCQRTKEFQHSNTHFLQSRFAEQLWTTAEGLKLSNPRDLVYSHAPVTLKLNLIRNKLLVHKCLLLFRLFNRLQAPRGKHRRSQRINAIPADIHTITQRFQPQFPPCHAHTIKYLFHVVTAIGYCVQRCCVPFCWKDSNCNAH